MRNRLAIFALLIACGTGTVRSQNTNSFKIDKRLLALNFMESVSFTSELINNFPANYSTERNTISMINTGTEVGAGRAALENNIERLSALQFKYAMMMDVEVEALTNNAALYQFIDDWYGTHYRMGGTTKNGIDCSAFSGTLLSTIYSIDMPRTAREQYKICEKINKDELVAGDLVFFNIRGHGVSHVGVYLANDHFIHSSSSDGVKISSLDEPFYSRKFIGGGRVNQ